MAGVLQAIAAGAPVNGDSRNMPLHEAISRDATDIIEVLVAAGADMTVEDCGGRTPLVFAFWPFLKYASFRTLLDLGAPIPVPDARGPLTHAVVCGIIDCVVHLLAHGADPFNTAPGLKSPYELAVVLREREIVALFDSWRGCMYKDDAAKMAVLNAALPAGTTKLTA